MKIIRDIWNGISSAVIQECRNHTGILADTGSGEYLKVQNDD